MIISEFYRTQNTHCIVRRRATRILFVFNYPK